MVELFGDWVTFQETAGLVRTDAGAPGAFRETLGVETVQAKQMKLLTRSSTVKLDLYRLLDEMPDALLEEVQIFAEFLQHRQQEIPKVTQTR